VLNWKPSDPKIACDQGYGTVETVIPLSVYFDPNKTT
jgi:hypothetical protein